MFKRIYINEAIGIIVFSSLAKFLFFQTSFEEMIVYCVLAVVITAYLMADLYLAAATSPEVTPDDSLKKDVEELKTRVNAMNLKEGLKLK